MEGNFFPPSFWGPFLNLVLKKLEKKRASILMLCA